MIQDGATNRSESTTCQNCKKFIRWDDYLIDDEQFVGVLDKLIDHINNDTECIRERKIKQILGEYKELGQDYYLTQDVKKKLAT